MRMRCSFCCARWRLVRADLAFFTFNAWCVFMVSCNSFPSESMAVSSWATRLNSCFSKFWVRDRDVWIEAASTAVVFLEDEDDFFLRRGLRAASSNNKWRFCRTSLAAVRCAGLVMVVGIFGMGVLRKKGKLSSKFQPCTRNPSKLCPNFHLPNLRHRQSAILIQRTISCVVCPFGTFSHQHRQRYNLHRDSQSIRS